MRIIKQGVPPDEIFTGVCKICGCEIECCRKECTFLEECPYGQWYRIKCPTCGSGIYPNIKANKKEELEITNEVK